MSVIQQISMWPLILAIYGSEDEFLSEEERRKINCSVEHTRADYRGNCVCEDGFFGDEPLNEARGCWKCTPKCHPHANCEHPGVCKCRSGLVGDGVNRCEPPVPVVTGVKNGTAGNHIKIEFTAENNFLPFNCFVRYSTSVLSCRLSSESYVECPLAPSGVDSFSLSFDGFNYSSPVSYPSEFGYAKIPKFQAQKVNNKREVVEFHPILPSHHTKARVITIIVCYLLIGVLLIIPRRKDDRKDLYRRNGNSGEYDPLLVGENRRS